MLYDNTYHIRSEARLVLSLKQLAPVDVGEEVVGLDIGRTIGTQATLGITIKQLGEKITRRVRHNVMAWEGQRLLQDLAVHLVGVFVIERRKTSQHLVEQNTQCPPIDALGVAIAQQKLWSEVLGGTAECCLQLA